MNDAVRPSVLRRAVLGALGAAVAVALSAPVSASATDPGRTVEYRASSDADIANPERGFHHLLDTHYRKGGKGWEAIDAAQLRTWRREGQTLINRVIYLDAFAKGADLSAGLLRRLDRDFAAARRAGVSLVPRFAYKQGGSGPYEAPFGDADLPVVLKHIRQLTPVLRANVDVIPTVQSGFVGLWGEGYYTDYFADPKTQVVSDAQWEQRRAVVDALLEALPTRTVQVRTPQMKQRMVPTGTGRAEALKASEAFQDTRQARIGHHNDCFLASPDDFGTFLSDPITLDRDYLAQDTRYVPMGGETCAVAEGISEFPNARKQLARYHFSYLNLDYNTDVLDSWGAKGLATVERRLGYRLELLDSTVRPNGITIRVRNSGWAAPITARPVRLVLQGTGGRLEVPFETDIRRWRDGTTTELHASLAGLRPGRYRAFLAMPSGDERSADDPRFAIRTANVGTWDARTGLNDLHQRVEVH